jgi:prepilin-type N-terminal cleavage/methylation domain-containing protein
LQKIIVVCGSQPRIKFTYGLRRGNMERINSKKILTGSSKGFTMMELLTALAVVAVLTTMATPSFVKWRRSLEGRSTMQGIVSALRLAKNMAIDTNLEHRVEFESNNRRYRITRGNRPSNSIEWNTVVCDWVVLPSDVTMETNVKKIQLNTNGTANGGTIKIHVADSASVYKVRVAPTGRIWIPEIS